MIRQFIIWLLAILIASVLPLDAQSLRIVTAQVDGVETAGAEMPAARLEELARVLRPVDADLIVVEGIPQRAQAATLAALLKPSSYQLAVFAAFTNAGSTTIFSKRQPFGARSAEWRATGQMELPGGFGFAGFRSGTNAFCFYVANLPGNGAVLNAAADPQAARRREIAAQYLVQHVQWLNSTLSNHLTSFCIVGDLVMDAQQARLENAGRILQQAGFGAWLAPLTPATDVEVPFTALLARGAMLRSAPAIVPQSTLKQPVCVYEINPGGKPGAVASAEASGKRTASAMPGAAVLWIWTGVIVGVCALTLGIWWLLRRSAPSPAVFRSSDGSQLVLEVDEVTPLDDVPRAEAGGWRAMDEEQRVEEKRAHARAGLLQHLQSLVRDRFVAWLSAQRGKLVESHDAGTRQVLELEERLQQIQGHFEEQIQNRDQRITELEREIQAKEALIRKLLLARANPSNQSPAE